MRKVFVIGIGAGDPEHVTVQAIKAMNEVDVIFVLEKANGRHDLVQLRKEICERYIENRPYRLVEVRDPERDRKAPAYRSAVDEWRLQRADIWERAIGDELGDDDCGAFLVWGDPALYDSTLAVVERIRARGALRFDYEVVPGISSIQALAARHRVSLTRVGGPVHITTGRRLSGGFPDNSDDVVVMLDAGCAFKQVEDSDVDIYWGAYIGTEDETLVAGKLVDVTEEIERIRSDERQRKGWIMDTYLLRRNADP